MSQKKAVPSSLEAFLKEGIEQAQCNICLEPFDCNHVPVQIKECGHHFGEECLKRWLETKGPRVGTCPTCRGVLFQAQPKVSIRESPPAGPPSLDSFIQFYSQSENVTLSSRSGFLANLWLAKHRPLPPSSSVMDIALRAFYRVCANHNEENLPEVSVLSPYIPYLRNGGDNYNCALIALADTVWILSNICSPGFTPSDLIWKAIIMFHTQPGAPRMLTWAGLCNTAWNLHENSIANLPPHEHWWRILYLFLCFMAVYRAERLKSSPVFKITQVREMLSALEFDFPVDVEYARETSVRLLESAAVHALEYSAIDAGGGGNERSQRLADSGTAMVQLKADVEAIWVKTLNEGEIEVAVGYPDHWWAGCAPMKK